MSGSSFCGISPLVASTRGASFENPLSSLASERNPNTEMFLVLDLSRGWICTVAYEARDYRAIGYPIFDLYGNRVIDFDDHLRAALHETPLSDSFAQHYEEIFDVEDQIEARNSAHLDEEIYYDTSDKSLKRRKITTTKDSISKDREDDPSAAASTAASICSSRATAA